MKERPLKKETTPKEIGKRIKKFRQDLGYTQIELADKMHIGLQHLQAIEQGRKYPATEDIIQFQDIFDCDFDYIYGSIDKRTNKEAAASELTGLNSDAIKAIKCEEIDPFNKNVIIHDRSKYINKILLECPDILEDICKVLESENNEKNSAYLSAANSLTQNRTIRKACMNVAMKLYSRTDISCLGITPSKFASSYVQDEISDLEYQLSIATLSGFIRG